MRSLPAAVAVLAVLTTAPASAEIAPDAVLKWNQVMLSALAGQNPFASARIAAMTHVAIFEAVNAILRRYEPYLGTVTAPADASAEAAAVAAGHTVLVSVIPAMSAQINAARDASLAEIPDGPAKEAGIAAGEAAAAAIVAHRTGDGALPPLFFSPVSGEPGQWQTTQGCPPAGGILFHWQNVAPFAIDAASQFRPGPPPPLESGRYRRAYAEVKALGSAGSTERPERWSEVARFYNAVLAVGVWNPVARQLSLAKGTGLAANARAFALLNMAIADALVAVMETKYHYTFWRPETAIRAGDTDGNERTEADPLFAPLVTTPCFPGYPSAHAAGSNAARRVIEKIWGRAPHEITVSDPAMPGVELRYTKLRQITDDIDGARIYGGIHFRFDQEAGSRQGVRIGSYIVRHTLRRLR